MKAFFDDDTVNARPQFVQKILTVGVLEGFGFGQNADFYVHVFPFILASAA